MAQITPSNTSSLTEYFSSSESNAVPKPGLEALHTTRETRFCSKCLFCVISETNFYNVIECCVVFKFPINWFVLFSILYSSGRRAAAFCAKLGT